MKRWRALFPCVLFALGCGSEVASGGSGAAGGGAGGGGDGGGGSADPCAGVDLPLCPPPCPEGSMGRCGAACSREGEVCGNEIGDGMACSGGTWQCTVHPPLGGPGECNLVCQPLCAPMRVEGSGDCDMIVGYAWDGAACAGLSGCSCAGPDCDALSDGPEECSSQHSVCTGYQACAGLACGDPCSPCDPADGSCVGPELPWSCDEIGVCGPDAPTACGDPGPICETDSDCLFGSEWCLGGTCQACDNDGLVCDIACDFGWQTYERNGCFPCVCAPPSDCSRDEDCGVEQGKCYAGAFCWDYCAPGDPSCCLGNTCSAPGCEEPPPVGCFTRGCPMDQHCVPDGCASSSCGCGAEGWFCTDDCSGGVCVDGV